MERQPGLNQGADRAGQWAEGCQRTRGTTIPARAWRLCTEDSRKVDGDAQGPAPVTQSGSAAVHAEAERAGEMCGAGRCCGCFGVHRGDQPRGFLRAGSCVTASATEPRPRSQVYLRRPRWAGVRHAARRIPGEGGWSQSLGAKSSRALTRSQLEPGGCHRGPGSGAVPPSSPQRSPPGKEEQDNGNGGVSRCP